MTEETLSLSVSGMTCAACAASVERGSNGGCIAHVSEIKDVKCLLRCDIFVRCLLVKQKMAASAKRRASRGSVEM